MQNLDLNSLSALSQLIAVFGAGVLSSLQPCVYPLIPITIAIFGAKDEKRLKAFFLSSCYVLGIAVTYTILGSISALTGALFGSLLGNPYIVGMMVLLMLILSLYSLEIFQFSFLSKLESKASKVGGKGFVGAFLMGLVSGVVAAPCVGPVLVSVLQFAALSKSPTWGAILLFTYSLGLGLLFLILGTFSGLLKRIPKSGNWMNAIKFGLSSAILMFALYLAATFFNSYSFLPQHHSFPYLWPGIGFSAIFFARYAYIYEIKLLKVFLAFVLAITLYQIFIPRHQSVNIEINNDYTQNAQKLQINWHNNLEEAIIQANKEGKPIIIDLFADWCAACKEFDGITFQDTQVINKLSKFVAVRLDFSQPSELQDMLVEKFAIVGLPTLIFLNPDGSEIVDSRITGFKNPDEFLSIIDSILAKDRSINSVSST